jgi:hypothetical protein
MAATGDDEKDENIAHCVAHYRGLLDARPQTPESLSQAPDSRLRVIMRRAGAERRSEQLLARLDRAFKDAGIETFPPLTDPGLGSEDRVWMYDASHPIEDLTPTRQLFHDEKTLESFILANRDELEELREFGLKDSRAQVRLDSGRRIDLLCNRPTLNQS